MRFTRVPWISCECASYTSQEQYSVDTLPSHHAQTLLYDHKIFLAPLKEGIEVCPGCFNTQSLVKTMLTELSYPSVHST